MSKKNKNKEKRKDKKAGPKSDKADKGLKKECCEKYKKGEDKRCKRCPCFDL
ncbi:hypothetical protein IWX84_000076 [Flavobacterium sp. CG_9.10]|uniref:hypothetical protein n=1 Tax=Flavobacterium sp. CG_9.10 TaxID=2787729 RepID=UPI0018CAA33A|nr:hypothetical protein [Flavobacterium sp. CG_9.10]MBG6109221.1 hypothetical protein [Flavobacterium sp. CG_9.10]